MADEKMPRKVLKYDLHNYTEDISEVIAAVENELKKERPITPTGYYLPYISGKVDIGSEQNLQNMTIYKVNRPVFIYRQHYNGDWSAAGGIGIFVSSDPTFRKAYELMRSGAPGGSNGHMNQMFGINPGKNTYICFISDTISNQANKEVSWMPAFGILPGAVAMEEAGTLTSLPSIVENDPDGFKACFEL